ncbi:MAG: helix-turn-helix domain-containing protein [Nevskia sp.]|nr:helix-turn-helix domain-containing protein [Nevskia sp.]
MKETRVSQGLSLEDVAQQTYIKLPYLIALEEEQYEKLPAAVYTYGYIRQYAKLLKLDGAELVSRYQAQQESSKGGKAAAKASRNGDPHPEAGTPPEVAPPPVARPPAVETRPEPAPPAPAPPPAPPPVDREKERQELDLRVDQARQHAQQLLEKAHGEAKQLRAGAERYAEQVLAQLEQEIQRALVTIKNGRSYLHSRQLRRRHPESG